MAKLTAWLVTLVGVILLLPLIGVKIGENLSAWLVALSFLIIGIGKLVRNYSKVNSASKSTKKKR
ncbi:MAG: hypothetical protein AABW82_03705 [Nanoarchaeota archaeon]